MLGSRGSNPRPADWPIRDPMGPAEFFRIRPHYIPQLPGGGAEVVNRKTLKPLRRDAILRDAESGSRLHWGAKLKEFRFRPHIVFLNLFRDLGSRLLGSSLQHHHRWRRGRQILYLHMDREAFPSNLADDHRGPGFFFWRFRKRQHVVLAVLHNNSHAFHEKAKSSHDAVADFR